MRSGSRIYPLILALLGAALFALAMQSAWWLAGNGSIGPFGARQCMGGECSEVGLTRIGGGDLWMRSGIATRAGSYISMLALIAVAGALAARRVPRLLAKASIVAMLTAAVSGIYFALAFPGFTGSSVTYGIGLFGAAIALGVASTILTMRLRAQPRT